MTAIHVEVTAEHIGEVDAKVAWADPVVMALEELTGQDVDIDGDGATGNIATIGQGVWTIVVDLPEAANAWLNRRWDHDERGEPFAFDIEIPTWVADLVCNVDDEELTWVTLEEAARALKTISAQGLRTAAANRRNGAASERALAARLGMRRVGRDWLIPRARLDAEVRRRENAS